MADASNYTATRERIRALKDEAQKQAKAAFEAGAAEIFAKHPKLESFSWRQYTPYFNDGDTCYFSVRNDEVDLKFDGEEVEDFYLGGAGDEENPELRAVGKDIHAFLGIFEDKDYEHLFGDHKKVTVHRKGTDVDDYEHD